MLNLPKNYAGFLELNVCFLVIPLDFLKENSIHLCITADFNNILVIFCFISQNAHTQQFLSKLDAPLFYKSVFSLSLSTDFLKIPHSSH